MRTKPTTDIDLTATPADGNPSSDADPVILTTTEPPEPDRCESCGGHPQRGRKSRRSLAGGGETSNLSVRIGLLPPRLVVALNVEGPLSWATPLCAVLLLAVLPVALVPNAILAGAAGGSVLIVGTSVLVFLVRRGKQRDDA